MGDFNFEYSDIKSSLKLIGLSFLVFVLLIIAMILTVKIIGVAVCMVLLFGIPLLIFFMNKKK
jgi:Flp pilus assembly protein TadB